MWMLFSLQDRPEGRWASFSVHWGPLLVSLALTLTLPSSLAAWFVRGHAGSSSSDGGEAGFVLKRVLRVYEWGVRRAPRHGWLTMMACALILVAGILIYRQLETDFLPEFDEGGFVMDYTTLPGTSLAETARILDQAEKLIAANPDVQGHSRRLGTQLGPFITEPYIGDHLIKLKAHRKHTAEEVLDGMRHLFNRRFPMV
jgi:multidrug efflux pump subunit AcrB